MLTSLHQSSSTSSRLVCAGRSPKCQMIHQRAVHSPSTGWEAGARLPRRSQQASWTRRERAAWSTTMSRDTYTSSLSPGPWRKRAQRTPSSTSTGSSAGRTSWCGARARSTSEITCKPVFLQRFKSRRDWDGVAMAEMLLRSMKPDFQARGWCGGGYILLLVFLKLRRHVNIGPDSDGGRSAVSLRWLCGACRWCRLKRDGEGTHKL